MPIMKRTKRDENKIILWNIFFVTVFLTMIFLTFFHLLPKINEIDSIKESTKILYENLKAYEKQWISFEEFTKVLNSNSQWTWATEDWQVLLKLDDKYLKDQYINSLIKEIDKDFYDKNFKNNTASNYDSFISEKVEEYKNNKNSDEKIKVISKVLPYYSDNIESSLTDFQFINYIESIIYAFNLKTKDPIWVKELKELDWYGLSNSDNSLDKWIYEIGLDLNLTWRKESIIDFLYFIENVWKIKLDSENDKIILNEKTFKSWDVFSNFSNKILGGKNEKSTNYNIFDNQIVDIENITMKEYIDSSDQEFSWDNLEWFLKSIKTTQWRDKYEISVKLKFYVKWLPKYKIDEVVSKFYSRLTDLNKKIDWLMNDKNISVSQKNKISNMKISLWDMDQTLKEDGLKDNLNEKLQYLNWFVKVVDDYEKELNKIK